jgi:hypothetical protein
MKKTWMRLNVNYLSADRSDLALETSSPVKSLSEGLEMYTKTIMLEKCADNDAIPPRASLIKYVWDSVENKTVRETIVSNESYVPVLLYK